MQKHEIDYTKHPELDDRLREPLDEEERELMDPDTWDWDNVYEVTTGPGGVRWVFEVPLEKDELFAIEPAAIAKGMTIIAFLKDAALRAARQTNDKQRKAS
jgi:hypothetical protein